LIRGTRLAERQHRIRADAIQSLNARFRTAVRHRGHFPTEQSALKVLYLVAAERRPNRSNPKGQINGWKAIRTALTIHYGDRIETADSSTATADSLAAIDPTSPRVLCRH
jgi:transposase-like protein